MYSNPQKLSQSGVLVSGQEAGSLWLKQLREARGLSQRGLANVGRGGVLHLHIATRIRSRTYSPGSLQGLG